MKIQITSDVHMEHYMDEGRAITRKILEAGGNDVDVLVLAGDIWAFNHRTYEAIRARLGEFLDKVPHVVYVTGNHEYYGSSVPVVHELLQRLEDEFIDWFHVLRPRDPPTKIYGQHFWGGTMWFPDHPMNVVYAPQLNDFNLIENFTPWVYDQNKLFRQDAQDPVKVGPSTIVVTHHLPSYMSINAEFYRSPLNRFFVSEETEYILARQPRLWIHGHTHTAADYMIDKTRVICNPAGYPMEACDPDTKWNPGLTIEVEDI